MKGIIFISVFLFSLYFNENCVFGVQNLRSEFQVKEQFLKHAFNTQNSTEKLEFQKMIEIFSFPNYMHRSSMEEFSRGRQSLTCLACKAVINTVGVMHGDGVSESELLNVITDFCVLLQIQTENVCRGAIALNLPIILYVMENTPGFKSESFCAMLYNSPGCQLDETYDFELDIPPKNTTTQAVKTISSTPAATMKIAQLTDIHYDPLFEANGLAQCAEPTCCRLGQSESVVNKYKPTYDDESSKDNVHLDSNGIFTINLDYADDIKKLKQIPQIEETVEDSKKGGYWGDYRSCDAPWWAVEESIDRIAENHKDVDFVYYTGDTIDHGVWETSKSLVTESVTKLSEKLKKAFGDTPVFSAFGNHDTQPVNQFAPSYVIDEELSSGWLYDMVYEQWSKWLPAEAADTIKMGGFYTVLVKPGFRIISINSNLCNSMNWWIHMQPKDPSGQLQWMVDTLLKAEMNGEKVHLLSHAPAGGCTTYYAREFKRIIDRFSETIVSEFNGDSHKDHFKVYYSKEDFNKPIGVAWIGGSVTPYSNLNPNYKIYDVNSDKYTINDMEVWVYNLTEANFRPESRPNWYKEYSFREVYGTKSLMPEDMDELLLRMVTKEQKLFLYYTIFSSKSANINVDCNDNCVRNHLAGMTITDGSDGRKFEALWKIYLDNKGSIMHNN